MKAFIAFITYLYTLIAIFGSIVFLCNDKWRLAWEFSKDVCGLGLSVVGVVAVIWAIFWPDPKPSRETWTLNPYHRS